MGQKLTHKYKKCDYSTITLAGLDWGFLAVVETHICLKCKEVVDVLVGEHGEVFDKDDLMKQNFPITDFYTCPDCGGNDIEKWNKRKRPCPKCGGRMEVDEWGEQILWD